VEWGIDMQLADVRDLLRLPLPDHGLDSGQNFSAAATLVNLIGGASVWFYDASEEGLSNRQDRARRYDGVLKKYWAWDDGEAVSAGVGGSVLYSYARNPLAHSFGMPDPADDDGIIIRIVKRPLVGSEILELDQFEVRPAWLPPTVAQSAEVKSSRAYDLSVPALYWGVRRLIFTLLTNAREAEAANELGGKLIKYLTDPTSSWRKPPS